MQSKWVKGGLTVFGAVMLSTLSIFAADTFQGIDSGFSNIAGIRGSEGCSEGSVPFKGEGGVMCVDIYEASPSKECPNRQMTNAMQTEQNASTKDCYAVSVQSANPWTYVSLPQAQRLCAAAGKRLPTSDEWYKIALGTTPESCVVNKGSVSPTGTESCISQVGAFDVVGNVWEWVDESVVGNTVDGRTLPGEGYVTSVDAKGVAITSGESADELYGSDYFWSKEEGVFGMIRGGFYGSNKDAGLYTVNASVLTSFATQGVGFRCVEDLL